MPKERLAPHSALVASLLTVLVGVLPLACTPPSRSNPDPTGSSAGTSGGATGAGGAVGSAGSTGSSGSSGSGGHGSGVDGTGGSGAVTGTGNGGGTGNSAGTGSAGTGNSAGSGNTAGTGNSGGTGGTGLSRGPTPPKNGANFPFPQNRQPAGCITPTNYDNNDVLAAYDQWKTDLVTSTGAGTFQRVQRTSSDGVSPSTPANSTVSEGIGYGMLIAVYMGDPDSHTLFDNLWKYEQLHLDGNNLMNWSIDSSGKVAAQGSMTLGGGGATDADEDMAFALAMADKQWGSAGALNYATLAQTQIAAVWNHEVYQSKLAGPGDSWGPTDLFANINISYFAPAYYRVFKNLDSAHAAGWDAVTQTVFDTIDRALTSNGNASNGLVPAWCSTSGSTTSCTSSGAGPFNYQYDSCRTPFRLGIDWCWNGAKDGSFAAPVKPSRAQAYVAKTSSFFSSVGAANIIDGYNLDGSVSSGTHTSAQGQSAAFVGPAGVGAMASPSYQAFLDAAYARVKTRQLTIGGAYYDESWTVMSLLMMTGNFLDYTAISPAQ